MWLSINGDIPIAGWFMVENPMKIDVKWGTPILGTPKFCFISAIFRCVNIIIQPDWMLDIIHWHCPGQPGTSWKTQKMADFQSKLLVHQGPNVDSQEFHRLKSPDLVVKKDVQSNFWSNMVE
jgi:hypothetical protein